jgi:carbamoyl-phosphate synthase large subunit
MSKKISVLATAIGEASVGGQVLKALRLAKTNYYIIGVDMSPLSSDFSKVNAFYLVPPASSSDYIEKLKKVCLKEKVDFLIPGSEPELLEISKNREKFLEIDVTPIVAPREVIETCLDKWKTNSFLKRNGFSYPKAILVENESDISKVNFYPAVIKPARSSSGSKNVFLIQNREEAIFFAGLLRRQGCAPLIQEYVGSHNEEYTVGVLTLLDGEIAGSIALRKLLSGLSRKLSVKSYNRREDLVISTGISQGEVRNFPNVRKYSEAIAAKLGVRGPVNIQGRKIGNGFCTFEINPRFSGTTSIRALLGFNEPDILIRHLVFGEKPRNIVVKEGFALRGLAETYIPFNEIDKLNKQRFLKSTK